MSATMTPSEPMLINRLSRLVGERRVTIKEVAEGTGISYRALIELYHDRTSRIDLGTINKLCAFFDVGPEAIFEWQRTAEDPAPLAPRPARRSGQ